MNTLKNLVNKGVKVEMGIPYELWDEPSVEVADMKRQVMCTRHANCLVCLFLNYVIMMKLCFEVFRSNDVM